MHNIKKKIINYKHNMRINKPCIIRGMPIEVYHTCKGISNSGLKMLLDCPAKYHYKYISGEYEPNERPQFKIGKACHCYILEGVKAFENTYWHNPYATYTKEQLAAILFEKYGYDNVKGLRKDLEAVLLDLEGIVEKEIELNKNELNQVIGTARAIKANPKAKAAFSQEGESELSIFWIDEESGLWLKCRPDFLPYDCKLVPDYKTCSSAKPESFLKSFISYGYHVQGAMYRAGIKAVTGIDVDAFFFIAQEKEPPYITQPYCPDEMFYNYGDKAIRKALNKYLECKEKGFWGGYSENVIELSMAPKPDDLIGCYDEINGIIYSPGWLDAEILKYED